MPDADVLAAEPEQLAPAEPAERRHQHQGAVAGLYAVREVEDLIDGRKRSLRRLLHARAADRARVGGEEPVGDGRVQDRPQEAVALGRGAGAWPVGEQ